MFVFKMAYADLNLTKKQRLLACDLRFTLLMQYEYSKRHSFTNPRRRFTSETVYAEDMSHGAVAERALNSEEQNDLDEMDEDEDEEEEEEVTEAPRVDDRKIMLKELYAVALGLKENIRSSSTSWYEQWPPLASDITGENVRKIVTPPLFNFIAWVLGYSDEPEECEYVDLDEELTYS